jgi:MYXO-CTERM domain-containing protein
VLGAAPPNARVFLQRALDWVHRQVPYCQCLNGMSDPYRADCSGLVSMAWSLPADKPYGGNSTYDFAMGVWDNGRSVALSGWDQLVAGDAVNYPGDPNAGTGHIRLFAGWMNAQHTQYCSIEEYSTGTPARIYPHNVDTAYYPIRLTGWTPITSAPSAVLQGVKRGVTSPAVMTAWRWSFPGVHTISDTELAAFPDGVVVPEAPSLVKDPNAATVYLLDSGYKRGIPSPDVLYAWNFSFGDVVERTDLGAIPDGPNIVDYPWLIIGSGPSVYLLDVPFPKAPEPDAGTPPKSDGGGIVVNDAGGTTTPPAESGGCTMSPKSANAAPVGLLALFLLAHRARRSRRSR